MATKVPDPVPVGWVETSKTRPTLLDGDFEWGWPSWPTSNLQNAYETGILANRGELGQLFFDVSIGCIGLLGEGLNRSSFQRQGKMNPETNIPGSPG